MMKKKLRSKQGETLIETLVSIVVVTLSVVMLFTISMAVGELSKNAEILEEGHYQQLSAAETTTVAHDIKEKKIISVTGVGVSEQMKVRVYAESAEDIEKELKSYAR